ncbi:TonB-dependent receptor plug domain-containing protein [Leyella stercorea]|uniref:TonB-dependent receptor plug domain-containing protein n=1 Tax=Leyella stercorea TaxID=363265 RepID=UPI00266CE56A|nr:TonB-dependent receptor [Leyella stercorea]
MRIHYIILLFFIAISTHAQTSRLDSVHTIRDVAVVGVRPHYLTPSQTLSGAALQNLSTTSVADALKYFSGVQIKDYGGLGGLKTVNVRSLGSQHVGVYLDGIRITNAQNGQIDLGRYSLSNMESVALYNANRNERLQSASEYASAATVYLQTRRPDSTAFNVEYGTGSFGLQKLKTYFSFRNILFVDAEYQRTDGDYPFRFQSASEDTVGKRRNSDISFYRLEAAGFYKGFRAHAYFYSSERGLPGPVVRRLSDQWDSTDRQWDRNFFLQATYRHTWGSFALKTNLKYAYDWLRYLQDPSTNAAAMHCDNHYRQQDLYASVSAAWNTSWLSLTASTDLRWSDLTTNVYRSAYVYRLDSKSLLSAIASYRGFEGNIALLYTHIGDHSARTAQSGATLSRLTPMFLASWHRRAFTVRAFHKRIFRAPTLNDLYYTLVGNAQLRPEYTSQFDLGVDYKDRHLHLALDAYYNRIEDKIVAIPMKSQFRWSMVNFGLVKSLGLSATAGYDRTWGKFSLNANANYTCQRDRDYSSPHDPEYRNTIPYSPLHSASLIVDLGYDGWSLCTSWLYTGDRFALISNNRDDLLGAWQTVDLKLNKRFRIRRHYVQATVECNNLCDSRHEVVKRYPMPGRNWKATLQWQL